MASFQTNTLPVPRQPPRLDDCDKEKLLNYFDTTWELSDALMRTITGEGTLYRRADPLRHPLIFYLGHTAAFYVNKLKLAGAMDTHNDAFEDLFAMGVDPASPQCLQSHQWPAQKEVWHYRRKVYQAVRRWIQDTKWQEPIEQNNTMWALLMGMEHDLIHFETSSVLIRQYPVQELTRPTNWQYAPMDDSPPEQAWIHLPEGSVRLGKPPEVNTFGWDNEYGQRDCQVKPFQVSNLLVTNQDFSLFIAAEGYLRRDLWTEEGWHWLSSSGARRPQFWVEEEEGVRYRAMFDMLDMPCHWPVEVNFHEASAYCRFLGKGHRLPTEVEFRRISDEALPPQEDPIFASGYNLNLAYGSPCTVGSLVEAASPRGIHDVYGNVWSWLADEFNPLPGFRTHPLYEDFSEPFFTPDHVMLLGGSWASLGTSASRYYRLWFRRHFIQHAGFRVVRDID